MHRLYSVMLVLGVWVLARVLRRWRRRRRARWAPGAVALITGGGRGLGLALARRLAAAGCHVVLVGRDAGGLAAGVAACQTAGAASAVAIPADLRSPDGVQDVLRGFTALHGDRLRYLVLNAGAGAIGAFASDAAFAEVCAEMMRINYFANVWLLQAFLPQLRANHAGGGGCRIVVVSSLAGVLPSTLRSAYTASKHALQGFMNALRGEAGVPITIACPGYVDTDFHRRVITASGEPLPGSQRRGISPETCAKICLDAALHGDSEVIFGFSGKLGYALRPLCPDVVDAVARWISLRSIRSPEAKKPEGEDGFEKKE